MYKLNLSRGGYRLLFWITEHYANKPMKHGVGGWATKARVDLGYTQSMVSMLAKELEGHGLLKRTTQGFTFTNGKGSN